MTFEVEGYEIRQAVTGRTQSVRAYVELIGPDGQVPFQEVLTSRIAPLALRRACWDLLGRLGFSGHRLHWRSELGGFGSHPGFWVTYPCERPDGIPTPCDIFVTIRLCTNPEQVLD